MFPIDFGGNIKIQDSHWKSLQILTWRYQPYQKKKYMARVVIFEKEPWKRSELGQQNNMIYTIRSWGYMKNTLHSIGAGGIEEHPIISERGHQIGAQSSESKESSWNDSPEVAPPAISMGLCFWSWYKRLQAAPPRHFSEKPRETACFTGNLENV